MAVLVTDYLDESSRTYPDRTAFIDDHSSLSFADLRHRARCVASAVLSFGLRKSPVMICMEKGVDMVTAFLGVAESGNFYTPVDASMPAARVDKILATLEPKLIIVSDGYDRLVAQTSYTGPVISFDECIEFNIDEASIERALAQTIDSDLLYVLFTSGSTGIPKGVAISHRSVIDYVEWVRDTFDITSQTVFGNQAPFYFDNSILDIYTTLCSGACTYVIPKRLFSYPVPLLKDLVSHGVNTIFWVPSALCYVANFKALNKVDLSQLKKILFCGEVMPNKQLNAWRRAVPNALFANLYGPTEITDVCAYYIVDREFDDADPLPIGKPCRNTDILVLNERDELVGVDEVGELCVRGNSLALGYYNNSEKTAEAFTQNPLQNAYPERIYRTGDLVKYNDRGEIMYLSRKDSQIKIHGRRVELGEIETAAAAQEGIQISCCLFDEARQQIVLVYVGKASQEYISEELSKLIPEYMIPGRFISLDVMPMNLNGKIDRVKLRDLL